MKMMMSDTQRSLQSLMKEANLHPRIQDELLRCASSGRSFPFVPRTSIKTKDESVITPKSLVPRLPSKPILRPKETIERLGDYERDKFRPIPAQTRPPHEKQRLQNLMAYGKDIDEELRNINLDVEPEESKEKVDLFSEILREIQERKEFLDDMIALGEGKKYLPEIQSQISLRLRELEKFDKERAQAFIQKYGL